MEPNPLRLEIPLSLRRFALALAIALAGVGPQAAAAATVEIDCYDERYDGDRDGYAESGAPKETKNVEEEKKLHCPDGYVKKAGDCDDALDFVHPHAPEIGFNLRDDDCDGSMDETQVVHLKNGNQNGKTSFSIRVRLGHWALINLGSSLAYEIEYSDLAASAVPLVTPKRPVGTLPSDYTFDAPLAGLQPARVYRARLNFYKATTTTVLALGKRTVRTSYTSLEKSSEWYYSATDGDGDLEEARSDLLLDGFYELSESDRGRVGYRGTADRDGTRYGAAPKERWCSEFYVWLAESRFWQIGYATNVPSVITWFAVYREWYPGSASVPSVGRRADYVAVDVSGDGVADHSTMFLAYDPTTARVWTLEGNDGNYVTVRQRPVDGALRGVGHLAAPALLASNPTSIFEDLF
jgi:hypothetical protein